LAVVVQVELLVLLQEEPADLGRSLHQSFLLVEAGVVYPLVQHQLLPFLVVQAAALTGEGGLVLKV
jgi:hypothetical protein